MIAFLYTWNNNWRFQPLISWLETSIIGILARDRFNCNRSWIFEHLKNTCREEKSLSRPHDKAGLQDRLSRFGPSRGEAFQRHRFVTHEVWACPGFGPRLAQQRVRSNSKFVLFPNPWGYAVTVYLHRLGKENSRILPRVGEREQTQSYFWPTVGVIWDRTPDKLIPYTPIGWGKRTHLELVLTHCRGSLGSNPGQAHASSVT